MINTSNPFEVSLSKKRDAEESGMDAQSQETVIAQAASHPVMPLPKRRIVSYSDILRCSGQTERGNPYITIPFIFHLLQCRPTSTYQL